MAEWSRGQKEIHRLLTTPTSVVQVSLLQAHFFPMQVIPFESVFSRLNEIPRYGTFTPSYEGTLPPNSFVIFVSHRWLRPGLSGGHPDSSENEKHMQITSSVRFLASREKLNLADIYLWIDYSCVPQDNPLESRKAINALPVYIRLSHAFLVIHHPEYLSRAWCLVEALTAKQRFTSDRRVVFKEGKLAQIEFPRDLNPLLGKLTSEADASAIQFLTYVLDGMKGEHF